MGKRQQTEIDANQNYNEMQNQMHFVREKLEQFQRNILRDVEKRMTGMIDDVLQDMREHQLKANEFRDFASKTSQQQHQITSNGKLTDQQQQQQSVEHRQKHNVWSNRVSRESATVNGCALTQLDGNLSDGSTTNTTTTRSTSKQHRTARALPDKVFVMRESYLTALLQVDHMRTIYHIFHIILLIQLLNSVCYDYFVEGSIKFGLRTFKSGLNKIQYVFGIWMVEHVFVFSLYYAFSGWATIRQRLCGQQWLQRFWSHSCLIVYIGSQLVFAYVATVACLRLDLPYVSASVLLLESTRLLMKMHAYVRTNAARVLAGKQKLDENDHTVASSTPVRLPTFGSYLYFLFAPTLIYRDSYPRTARIRWQFALARFLEVVAVAFLFSYLHERHIQVHFSKIGLEPLNASMMLVKFFGMLMPGILIFLGGFYLILHAWLNFTAEILRFGDRMFYKDWWTSITYDAYYRNWNVVVHDWLYEYIYKDFYTYVYNGSKLASSLTVFMISAIVHEHIIGVALQFFFPVMFIFFGVIGVLMVFITRRLPKTIGNIFLWFSLITGNGTLISLYAMEFFAQKNCPKTFSTWSDHLTPAILNCY